MQGSAGTWNYTYNSDGMRISRTSLTDSYSYWYDGDGRLLRMKYNDIVMSFSYSANGQPMSITYNGAVYYYLLNAQGDVVGLIDSTGAVVVQYTYDAWGRLLSTTGTAASALGINNPLRYRSYIYDHETGLYYLQSRYYNPTIGRFINADSFASTGQGVTGANMFAYCGNNPVSFEDSTGCFFEEIFNFLSTVGTEIANKLQAFAPAYAGCTGFAVADGPLFFGDALTSLGWTVITFVAIADGFRIATGRYMPSQKEKKIEQHAVVTTQEQLKQSCNYWSASLINGQVTPIAPLTYTEAQMWIAGGNDLLCANHASAIALVKFWPTARWDERHGCLTSGYLNHYHLSSAHNNHIWYYGE